jgi:hypothetical protein
MALSPDRINEIIQAAGVLVTSKEVQGASSVNPKGETVEGKTQLVFSLSGHLVPVKTAAGNVMTPYVINRKSVSPILQSALDNTMSDEGEALEISQAILKVSGTNLIKWVDKKVPRFSEWLNQKPEFVDAPERFLAVKVIISKMASIMAENDKAPGGIADPDSTVKGIFAKQGSVTQLNLESINPQELVKKALETQIADLQKLLVRSQEITKEEYVTFVNEKAASCGLNDDGSCRLKKPSEKKPSVTTGTPEVPEDESTEGYTVEELQGMES